jgi:hypothetical protein
MEETSFCEQKEAKKLYESGAGSLAPALPHHRTSMKESFYSGLRMWHRRCQTTEPDSIKFLCAFFKKHCLSKAFA